MPCKKEAQFFKYQILGDDWMIYLVPEHDNVMIEEGSEAETNLDTREMYFKDFSNDSIVHELAHVYFRSTYCRFTEMSVSDMEEVCVALIADRGRQILKQADEIEAKLRSMT